MITKTRYLDFLKCPKNAWLKFHKEDLAHLFQLSDFDQYLIDEGHKVESIARRRFPQGILIEGSSEDIIALTQKHIELRTPVIFQAAFQVDQFFIRVDVLEFDLGKQQWNLYEIKATNSTDENFKEIDHVEDATFQTIVMKRHDINVGEIFILHLNKKYVFDGGDLDSEQLFTRDNITQIVQDRLVNTENNMHKSLVLLQQDEQLLDCLCLYKGRSKHCPTFSYSYPEVPNNSVHDLSRIGQSPKILKELVDNKIYSFENLPEKIISKFSKSKQKQIESYLRQKVFVDMAVVTKELEKLQYPLYFLDYESYPASIPLFKGFGPYHHIPFQFSLHVLEYPGAELKHYEYLHTEHSDPSLYILSKLQEYIKISGSIIVWHKSFEESHINKKLALRHPEYSDFLENINNRMFDLEIIFKEQYVHPEFKGKTSIKKILPVLIPHLSYETLNIQSGTIAFKSWYEMIDSQLSQDDQFKIETDLKAYCEQDTYAMYAILMKLYDTLKQVGADITV